MTNKMTNAKHTATHMEKQFYVFDGDKKIEFRFFLDAARGAKKLATEKNAALVWENNGEGGHVAAIVWPEKFSRASRIHIPEGSGTPVLVW